MAPLNAIINSINNIETNLQNTASSISQCTTIGAVKQLSWQLSSEISQLSKLKQDILDFESNLNQELNITADAKYLPFESPSGLGHISNLIARELNSQPYEVTENQKSNQELNTDNQSTIGVTSTLSDNSNNSETNQK